MSILYRTLYKYIILRVVKFPQLTMCCINLHLQHEPQLRVSHNGRRRPTCLVCTLPFPLVSIITSAVPGRYDKEKRLSWTGSEQCADAKHSATSLLKTNILTPNDRKRAHIKVSKYVKAYCGWQQNDRHATHNDARITDMPPTMAPESQTCHPQWCQNHRHATHNGARITDIQPTMVPESQTCHPQWCQNHRHVTHNGANNGARITDMSPTMMPESQTYNPQWCQNHRHATHNGARITDTPPTIAPESQTCHPQ